MRNEFTDKELVDGIISNNNDIIRYFFYEKCTPMFHSINHKVYNRQAEKNELVSELYLYLKANNWHKIRQFDYSTQLLTWVSFIAHRFFYKKRDLMIENEPIDPNILEDRAEDAEEKIYQSVETGNLLKKLLNLKYRFVLRKLFLEDIEPKKLADRMKISVENLYNPKRRAIQKLTEIVGKEKK